MSIWDWEDRRPLTGTGIRISAFPQEGPEWVVLANETHGGIDNGHQTGER